MARLLYTIETGHVDPNRQWHALSNLELALEQEFPAFRVTQRMLADKAAAVVVVNVTEDVPPVEAWDKLDGWGNGFLTLELVK